MTSHPRPDFRRDTPWQSLDGTWDFAIGSPCPAVEDRWGTIIVPFPWESEASGVAVRWAEHGWYRRCLELPVRPDGQGLVLHVGAAFYEATVLVDRTPVAEGLTGATGFDIDLTSYAGRTVEVVIGVRAPIDKRDIPHGKQRSVPADPYDSCSFAPSSGIWQSVWLEHRPTTHLAGVRLLPDHRLDRFTVLPTVHDPSGDGDGAGDGISVTATVVATGESVTTTPGRVAELVLAAPHPWSPADPHLYEIAVVVSRAGEVLDTVTCTTGLRWVETRGRHLLLNGERVLLRGVLDQGYWPDTGWASPGVEALLADLEAARAAGFTMVRKHLKLEDPRWLHAADRMGMLVWEEPPSTGRYTAEAVAAFERQLPAMVDRDLNHPSVIIWGLYNEEWGLDWDVAGDPDKAAAVERAYKQTDALDGTRLIVDNSGWSHVRTDLVDWHIYALNHAAWLDALRDLDASFAIDLGTAGGVVRKQLMADGSSATARPVMNSEYGTGLTAPERAWIMRWQTQELRRDTDGNGYVYCELYDIEHEMAGVLDAGRRPKDAIALRPADTHAETVIVVDLVPVAPGRDLVVDGDTEVTCRVVSSAARARRLELAVGWGPLLSADADPTRAVPVEAVEVAPFALSGAIPVPVALPPGAASGRLHLWLTDESARVVAHAVLDVVTSYS